MHVSEVKQKQIRTIKPPKQARCFLSEATGQPELVICFRAQGSGTGTNWRDVTQLQGSCPGQKISILF